MDKLEILICRSTNIFRTIWKMKSNEVESILKNFRNKTQLDSFDLSVLKSFIYQNYEIQSLIDVFDCEILAEETGRFNGINDKSAVWFIDFNIKA